MKTLLTLALATAAWFSMTTTPASAGESHSSTCKVHSHCSHCSKPVYSFYRPVRYVNAQAVYGWIPSYHSHCGFRSPVQVYNYGYGDRVTRYYSYPDVRSYNVYRTYPTSRARSTFVVPRCR